jgi:phosphopantothenoylcysteine decarboxylase/phosphopantothenate--cysteine ligase
VRKGKDLEGKRIALGVTGGIAAYKSAALCRELVGAGARVDALLTPSATRFITPLPFERITGRPVRVSRRDADAQPIDELAEALDLLIIAPLTAHTLARLAHGLGGDVLVDLALATRAPRLLAPAMEPEMWRHPATRRNAQCLAERGATLVGPAEGRLASGAVGLGRMVEPHEILAQARRCLVRAA